MTNTFTRRLIFIVPAGNQDAANQVAESMDEAGGGGRTFGRRFATDAHGATYTLCDTFVREAHYAALPAYSSLALRVFDITGGTILTTGASAWVTYPCQGWDLSQCLTDSGLTTPTPDPLFG